jgi:hypothetical protein
MRHVFTTYPWRQFILYQLSFVVQEPKAQSWSYQRPVLVVDILVILATCGTGLELEPTGGYLSRNRVGVKTYRRVSLQEQGWSLNLQEGLSRNRVGV